MNLSSEKTSSGRERRILVVDDERDIRDLLSRLLSKHGFDVAGAKDGHEALNEIRRHRPDVLLLDVSMPRLDGIELLKVAADLGERIPVVCAISGVADDAEIEEVLSWGATDFFRKPLDLDLVLPCIQRRLAEAEDHDLPEDYVERRSFLRVAVYLDKLQVTLAILGVEPTNGVVLNLSRGGMKVCLEHEIPKQFLGFDCLVRVVEDPQDRVSVKARFGKLLRKEVVGQYAIEFDKPLEVLRMGNGQLDSASQCSLQVPRKTPQQDSESGAPG